MSTITAERRTDQASSPETLEEQFEARKRVVYYSLRWFKPWFERHYDDLFQVGMMELWKVVNEGIDPELNETHVLFRRVRGAMANYCKSMARQASKTVNFTRRVGSDVEANHINALSDPTGRTPLQIVLEKERGQATQERADRLRASLQQLPEHRRELVDRYASGKFKLSKTAVPDGESVSSTVLRVLEFLESETVVPGTGDRMKAVRRPTFHVSWNGKKPAEKDLPQPKTHRQMAPESLRKAVNALWQQSFSADEIAKLLGMTPEAVKAVKDESRKTVHMELVSIGARFEREMAR